MVNIIYAVTSGITLLLILLLLTNPKKNNKKGNRWMMIFLTLIFLSFLYEGTLITGEIKNKYLDAIDMLLIFLIPPVYYLMTCYFIHPNKTWRYKDWLHFLSFGLLFLVMIPFSLRPYDDENILSESTESIFILFFVVQLAYYCVRSLRKIRLHQSHLKQLTSRIEHIDLQWLYYFQITFVIILCFWLIPEIFGLHFFRYISPMIYLFGTLLFANFAIWQEDIYSFSKEDQLTTEYVNQIPIEHSEDEISEDFLQLHTQLLRLMEQEKPYLIPEFNLPDLAQQLNTTTHKISFVLNKIEKKSFYNFINNYRVEHAKMLLNQDPNKENTILAIAFESGFSSKTAFNTNFKRVVGYTPSVFRKS